jgi:hypothetical protein
MEQDQGDFFAKTFDQQLLLAGGQIEDRDITPNRRIPGEIVFEPMGSGVRVTARDAEHRVLWGYVGSKETVRQVHCLVATYDTLQNMVGEELEKRGLFVSEGGDPIGAAQLALDALERTVKWLRDGLDVKKVSGPTLERARTIARIVSDAGRQIMLEANTLRGMKSTTEPTGTGDSE